MRISDWSSDVCSSDLTDAQNGLINGLWHRKGELPRIARDIIPFVAVELRFATGPAQSPFNRSPVIDARLNRIDEKIIDQISLMRTHEGAAGCKRQEGPSDRKRLGCGKRVSGRAKL